MLRLMKTLKSMITMQKPVEKKYFNKYRILVLTNINNKEKSKGNCATIKNKLLRTTWRYLRKLYDNSKTF